MAEPEAEPDAEPTGSVSPAAPDAPRHWPLDSALPPPLAVPVGVVDDARAAPGRRHGYLVLHA